MAELLQKKLDYEEQLEQDRVRLCSMYPGGPDGYRLVPARCVRVRDRNVTERNNAPSGRRISIVNRFSNERTTQLQRQYVLIRNRIHSLEEDVRNARLQNDPVDENTNPSFAHVIGMNQYWQLLKNQPGFILKCSKKMLSRRKIRVHDEDVGQRYRHIADSLVELDGPSFRDQPLVESAVLQICLARLVDMGLTPTNP